MTTDTAPLDGNAAAGSLADLFVLEMTSASVQCETCNWEGLLGTIRYYPGTGMVLRCPRCEAALLRFVRSSNAMHLDLRGCTRLSWQLL